MEPYAANVEAKMKRLYGWLSEQDRRPHAAVEAAKLGDGGVEYVSRLLGCDQKTIRQGIENLDQAEAPTAERVRKKGAFQRESSREAVRARSSVAWTMTLIGLLAAKRSNTVPSSMSLPSGR